MSKLFVGAALAGVLSTALAAPTLAPVTTTPALTSLPMQVGGRVQHSGDSVRHQWPGVYFESAFSGDSAYFKVGPGRVILHVLVDDKPLGTLVEPSPGTYRISRLARGPHRVRVNVATESQAGPNVFGGFAIPKGGKSAPLEQRTRQIEFIGDSHTVGYGNTSAKRECSEDEVWRTTDNTQAFGPVTARHYGADYRIHAISGRGVVRNYNGAQGDTLPAAYPFALFDHTASSADSSWQPQVIVIALGTNDFSTPLNAGERWPDREALRADYIASYVAFVKSLRARHPAAQVVLWATDASEGEIQNAVRKVVATLQDAGDARVSLVPVNGLTFTGCHYHPSVADSRTISQRLIEAIDRQSGVWKAP